MYVTAIRRTPKVRATNRERARKRVQDGTHQGWKSRTKLKPSYPEQYFITVLDNLEVSYIRELKVGKYFIDFAFEDKKIALEVDGKQHSYPEQAARDTQKDEFLNSLGWIVHRIKWVNPKTNKEALHKQIEEFKELLCHIYPQQ